VNEVGWRGSSVPPPDRVPLRAGPLSLAYVDGDLRDIAVGGVEVLRRIYVVFQDRNWTARPWVISNQQVFAGREKFEITFQARGTFDAEPFHFEAILSGDDEGTISYEIDGAADAPFIRNRLGLCVLHPMSAAGCPCIVEQVNGDALESCFPTDISAGQPFLDIRAITHEFAPGAWASVRLSGETWEMEDHRNWSDASFKTYCTPIGLPFPVEVSPDDSIWQSLTLAVDSEDYSPVLAPSEPTIRMDPQAPAHPLPRIGLQLPADEPAWSKTTTGLLRDLGLSHLRLDVPAEDPAAATDIKGAAARAAAIGARLVVALFVADASGLPSLASSVVDVDVETWLVFDSHAKVTGSELAAAARSAFGPSARVGGGTNLYFTELNREPPDVSALDVVAFSVNPQVHASDDQTLVQNLATQTVVAWNAARLSGTAGIHVSPVTLRPRFNPNATEPDVDHSNTPLPSNVDARQMSQLGANWTIASIKYLAESGAVEAITYYETTGWRGVIERDSGSSQPSDFPSSPGQPFPVHGALLSLVGFDTVRVVTSNLSLVADALLLENADGHRRLLVMTFAETPITVELQGLDPLPSRVTLEPFAFTVLDIRKAGS
jgi:hypothetical protein